jgi:hypothetical protein
MGIEVSWKPARGHYRETQVLWDADEPEYRINPGRKPTEQELTACPKVFTCFACLEKYPQRELGGRYHERWFCCHCIPYVDEWTAGAMVWWEEKRHKRHIWSQPKGSPPLTKAERMEQIRNTVRWCIANGYPIQTEETERRRFGQ